MDSTLLAVEASEQACSVALRHQGDVRQRFEMAARRHSERLLPMLDGLLRESGLDSADIEGIVFTRGPGAFTGIRIACSLVQGLAFATGVPVLPLSTLEALAYQVARKDQPESVCAALDARMGEIYWGLYRVSEQAIEVIQPESVSRPDAMEPLPAWRQHTWRGAGGGWIYAETLKPLLGTVTEIMQQTPVEAETLLQMAGLEQYRHAWVSADKALPVYLRDQVASKKTR